MFLIRRLFLYITILRIDFVMQIDRTVVAFLYIFLPKPMSVRAKNNNIMYIIILDAPLALAMAAGVMPVASIKWLHHAPPCRVLIYAAEAKQPISGYPVEWQMILHNAQVLGNIPHFVDLPTGCIVGWVDVYPHAEIPKLWNFGDNLVRVGNAHRFDEPFRCNIKHEGISFNLTQEFAAHKVKLAHLFSALDTLFVPTNARVWEQSAHGTSLVIDLFGDDASCLITEAATLREYNSVVLHHNGMYREFEFSSDNGFVPYLDERGKLKMYRSILRDGAKVGRTGVRLNLTNELNI